MDASRHRRRNAANREPGDGRHRRTRHPRRRVPELARDAGGKQRQPWKVEKIDSFPTSHHVAWADLDGDGRKELLNAPLIGEKSLAPTYDQDKASVFWYSPKDWKRHVITSDIPGIIHRVRPVMWDGSKREQFLVASFEGIALY